LESTTYAVESAIEQNHWWFVGRRQLFSSHIKALNLPLDAMILDVGTSTGTNLRLLKGMGFTSYRGLDSSPDAICWCDEKGLGTVDLGTIYAIPHLDSTFDLILATDIIEHLDDDVAALTELKRVLKPGGTILLTVPAFPCLWGLQDEVAHHKRRYRIRDLRERINRSKLSCRESYHFNFLLFLPIWLARRLIWLLDINLKSENQVNTFSLNMMLKWVFLLDVALARLLRLPFGVSILAIIGRDAP